MANQPISAKIDNTLAKINTILSDYMQLEKEYLELAEERNVLKEHIRIQEKRHTELEEKLKFLKLSKTASVSNEDQTELKATIAEIIKEIDKCIGMLNK